MITVTFYCADCHRPMTHGHTICLDDRIVCTRCLNTINIERLKNGVEPIQSEEYPPRSPEGKGIDVATTGQGKPQEGRPRGFRHDTATFEGIQLRQEGSEDPGQDGTPDDGQGQTASWSAINGGIRISYDEPTQGRSGSATGRGDVDVPRTRSRWSSYLGRVAMKIMLNDKVCGVSIIVGTIVAMLWMVNEDIKRGKRMIESMVPHQSYWVLADRHNSVARKLVYLRHDGTGFVFWMDGEEVRFDKYAISGAGQ